MHNFFKKNNMEVMDDLDKDNYSGIYLKQIYLS